MIILTRDGAQGSFSVDGNATLVLPTMFSPVTANPNFVYARIEFPVSTLPVGAHILSNSANVFHLGIIHTYDPSQSGCSYGYFSDFASLNLGPDLSVCPGASATFNAGPNRQNYQWFFNGLPYASGVQTITVTDTGSYSVTVDDHGCLLSDTIHLGNLTAPDPVLSGVTSFCQGESHTLTVNGSYPGYLWNTGATTGSVPVTTGGTYSVTVTDEAGCTGSTSAEVTVHSLPPVSLVQPAPTCLNTAPYPLSGGTPSGGIYGGFGVDPLNSYFSPSSGAGPHTITYTFTDAFGCTNADTNVLVVNDIPSVQLSGMPDPCVSDPPIPLTGGIPSGGSYFGNGVTSSTGYFDPTVGAGLHTVSYLYTDPNGCTDTATGTLTVHPLPLVALAAQPGVCISSSPFQLSGGTPAGGIYSGSGVDPLTGMFDPASGVGPHVITYSYSDGNGCTGTVSEVLDVYGLPVVQIALLPPVCLSTAPFPLSGGMPAGGTYSGPGVISSTGYFDPATGTGSHTITYTYADANGCTNTATGIQTVNALPSVTLQDQPAACVSDPPFPLAGGTPTGGTYSGPGVNTTTSYFDPSSGSGPHAISYTYTNLNGCTQTTSKTLMVHALPVVQLAVQPDVCINSQPVLLTGGTPPGGTYSGPGVIPSSGYFDPQLAGAGDHEITYTWTSDAGCVSSAGHPIHVIPLPEAAGSVTGPSRLCEASQGVLFTLSGSDPLATSFAWEITPPAAGSVTGNSAIAAVSFNNGFTGNTGIRFRPTGSCGTGPFSSYYNVVVLPNPEVTLTSCNDPVITTATKPFLLKGGLPSGGTWSVDGLPLPTGTLDPATLGTSPPYHPVAYTYTNSLGCSASASLLLKVVSSPAFSCGNLLTDIRDHKTYPTVEIVTGSIHRCWMASNLNYGRPVSLSTSQTDNCIYEKYCPGNDSTACAVYGGMYQWDELITHLPEGHSPEGRQGLCPPEWHVPSEAEWSELTDALNGRGMAGWRMLDSGQGGGFQARPYGVFYQNLTWAFSTPGFLAAFFWTSSQDISQHDRAASHGLNTTSPSLSTYYSARNNAFNVRCIHD